MTEYIQKKSSGLATLLSFLWCGLGQIYNGKILKGIILIVIYGFCVISFIGYISGAMAGAVYEGIHEGVTGTEAGVMTSETGAKMIIKGIIFGIIAFALWVYGMINAHKIAEKINRGELKP